MHAGFDVSGKVVVVTGGGQGIGRVYAQAFAAAGALPVIADRHAEAGAAVAAALREAGHEATAFTTDIADPASVDALVAAVLARHGRIDVLVNNASIFSTLTLRGFTEIPLEEWDHVLRVNVTGSFLMTRAVAPGMKSRGWGRVINMASAAVNMGRPNYLHYTTSKAAVIGMTRSLARELGAHGITVNAVLPGATTTEVPRETVTPQQKAAMIAMRSVPREEVPEDLVGTVLFLASEASAFVTGQSITVDGGLTFL
ncbi:MAG: 3-oxoacyl-ACP reductase FabG [Gammaproteobacteria bacterium]|nr:3-oxoacyl-ACP reductase FabG [Gammaproteobacteria bacterium]